MSVDFPIPGSPSIQITPPRPLAASASIECSLASSSSRPTMTGRSAAVGRDDDATWDALRASPFDENGLS